MWIWWRLSAIDTSQSQHRLLSFGTHLTFEAISEGQFTHVVHFQRQPRSTNVSLSHHGGCKARDRFFATGTFFEKFDLNFWDLLLLERNGRRGCGHWTSLACKWDHIGQNPTASPQWPHDVDLERPSPRHSMGHWYCVLQHKEWRYCNFRWTWSSLHSKVGKKYLPCCSNGFNLHFCPWILAF